MPANDHRVADRVVLGAEAGLGFAADDEIAGTSSGGAAALLNPKRSFDLSARAGYLVTDNALLYARGGYSNVRATTTTTASGVTLRDTGNLDGWLAGAGLEYALADNVSSRLEYRYQDLSNGDGKFDRHQVLVGIAYRF